MININASVSVGDKIMLKFLTDHVNNERASFHMPGHKGFALFARLGYGTVSGAATKVDAYGKNAVAPGLFGIADHDITEIPGADDLRHPDSIIKTLTDKYATLYGSDKAFISVNGSSALIMAAIMTCVKPGHKLIAAADSHISVKNGAALAGAEIKYVKPEIIKPWEETEVRQEKSGLQDKNAERSVLKAPGSLIGDVSDSVGFSIPAGISTDAVAEELDSNPDADAVILPSPNYFGIMSDIKAIAEVVHDRGKILIVDQAHGAHLKMFANAGYGGKMPAPAEECGADIVIVSTHKTLASFTQTAVANLFTGCIDNGAESGARNKARSFVAPDLYERNLLMLESTSPSYILMESLAVNADIMEKNGSELAASWRANLDWFYENAKTIPAIRVLTRDIVKNAGGIDFDDSKIVIDFSGIMLDGEEAEMILMEKGIFPEFHAGSVVMCLTGIGNVRRDYELLLDALAEMAWRDPFDE